MKVLLCFVGAATAWLLASGSASAEPLSDTLSISDTLGLNISGVPILETQEPGISTTIAVSARSFPGPSENGVPSDTLTIGAFTASLSSDADAPGPDVGEGVSATLAITAKSDTSDLPATVSDRLTVNGVSSDITESTNGTDTPVSVSITVPAATFPLTEANGAVSDTLSISAVTITLSSDNDAPGSELAETLSDTITVTALSDVPEPSTLALTTAGLFGLAFVLRRKVARNC